MVPSVELGPQRYPSLRPRGRRGEPETLCCEAVPLLIIWLQSCVMVSKNIARVGSLFADMPTYMDVHYLPGATALQVEEHHAADLAEQGKYGVEFLKY